MKKSVTAAATLILLSLSAVAASAAEARVVDRTCADVEAVFARGSGAPLDDDEAKRFEQQLAARMSDDTVTLNFYELGDDIASGGYGGHSYQAVDVDNPLNGNAAGAFFSAGYANDYGRSVDSGVGELYNYLKERQAKCSASRFVIGGYSQGGQVISQTLVKIASEAAELDDRIDFAAMFGDPKLYLPEGEGINPPACRGQNLSAWRRTVPDCNTDNGSLGARKPYLPTSVANKSGLWCYDDDFVCGSSKSLAVNGGHFRYADVGGAIDDAVWEIAQRLSRTLPPEKASGLNTAVIVIGTGTTGLDVVFVLDTTGSMGGYIEQAKAFARDAAASIRELRGRVALVAYKDAGDEYTARVFSGFRDDLTDFEAQLDTLVASGGGDTPEALLHALMTAFNSLEWRPGATKAAIVLTDAGFHEPDLVDSSTVDRVAARALEIDPVNVYPVIPGYLSADYQRLADLTTGQIIPNDEGDADQALTAALTRIRNRPVALLPVTAYHGRPGDAFTFDASSSYVVGSTITGYEWDFDGDGAVDQTTSGPVATHTYATEHSGVMQVRVTAADGGVANASATVDVSTEPPGQPGPVAPANLRADVLSTSGDTSTVRLSWTPADTTAAMWAVSVDGVPVGLSARDVTTVQIADVRRTADVTFGVTGMTDERTTGAAATVVLAAATDTPPVKPCDGRAPTRAKSGVHEGRRAIVGTSGDDVIIGTAGADVIVAGKGNDIVCAGGGNDVILGGPGNDALHGGTGRDLISGGPGNDRIDGGAGLDRCAGAPGRDQLVACEAGDPHRR